MHARLNSTIHYLSRLISNLFNPFTSLIVYFIYFSYLHFDLKDSLYNFLPLLLIIIVPSSFWLLYNVHVGNYQNMDVSNRIQRKSLYLFINGATVIYLLYNYYATDSLDFTVFFLLVLLSVLQISNFFIKSSMHTALNFYVAALFFTQSTALGILWCFIAALVGLSRIIIKRHTPKEVLAGFLLSAAVSFSYIYIFNLP